MYENENVWKTDSGKLGGGLIMTLEFLLDWEHHLEREEYTRVCTGGFPILVIVSELRDCSIFLFLTVKESTIAASWIFVKIKNVANILMIFNISLRFLQSEEKRKTLDNNN